MYQLFLNEKKSIKAGTIEYLGKNYFGDDKVKLGAKVYTVPAEDRTLLAYLKYALLPGLLTFTLISGLRFFLSSKR
jgi:hypothetical protein